jgi:hypothetical protein
MRGIAWGAKSSGLAIWLAILVVLTALYLAWPVWRAFLPLQIVESDAWNTFQADQISLGHPLYPEPGGLLNNNYPPLSFYLVSTLSSVTGMDGLLVGRLLSLLGLLATALAIFVVIRQVGTSLVGGLVGAISFVAIAARFYAFFVGINDPHLVALAIMMWALVWFFQRLQRGRAVEPAIVLMAVAGFYKHTLLAVPVASLGYLAFRDPKLALRAGLAGLGTAALGLALCWLVWGYAFLQNLLMPRQYFLMRSLSHLGGLQWIAPSLVMFGVWAWYRRQERAVHFTALFVFVAFINQLIQTTGSGVEANAHFELAAAAAIGVGLAFADIAAIPFVKRWGVERGRSTIIVILVARLVLSSRMAPYLLLTSPDFHNALQQRVVIAKDEIARISAIPGPVVCSVMTVCRLAGKSFLYDRFFVEQRLATGHISQSAIDEQVRSLGIRFETINPLTDLDRIRPP